MRRFRRYTKKQMLIASTLIIILSTLAYLSGCSTGEEGGGFDIVKLLQNPFVAIILVLLIVWWMVKHKRSG